MKIHKSLNFNILINILIILLLNSTQVLASVGVINSFEGAPIGLRNGTELPIAVGTTVEQQDTFSCDENCSLKIIIEPERGIRNILKIGPNTTIKINEYINDIKNKKNNGTIELKKGALGVSLDQKFDEENPFEVITPTAVVGVRGTEFIVEHDEGNEQTEVSTLRGEVEFGQRGEGRKIINAVRVQAGMTSILKLLAKPHTPVQFKENHFNKLREKLLENKSGKLDFLKNRMLNEKLRTNKKSFNRNTGENKKPSERIRNRPLDRPNQDRPKKDQIKKGHRSGVRMSK